MKFRGRALLFWLVLVLVVAGLLAGCSDDALTNPPVQAEVINAYKAESKLNDGDPAKGKIVFGKLPCLTCHTLEGKGGTEASAPALDGIGTNAGKRFEGVAAAQYIRHVLTKPEDLRLPGYKPIMPNFSASISKPELEDLMAFLLTLK